MFFNREIADQSHQREIARWEKEPIWHAVSLASDVCHHDSLRSQLKRFLPVHSLPSPPPVRQGLLQFFQKPALAPRLSLATTKIWFAGCGLSMGPVLYAALGHNVWASDISPVAITYQNSRLPVSKALAGIGAIFRAGRLGPGPSLSAFLAEANQAAKHHIGELHFLEHDFCTPFPESDFDCVLNVRAFQVLPREILPQVATVHWEALKPGGHAFFHTINVGQEAWRQAIEGALATAGFVVDSYAAPNMSPPPECKVAHVLYGMG
jgi:hypothetical protein